jgi:hypothetical protein
MGRLWNVLTGVTLLLLAGVGIAYAMIFTNPQVGLNPFPPSTEPALMVLPTYTATYLRFPPTWTPENNQGNSYATPRSTQQETGDPSLTPDTETPEFILFTRTMTPSPTATFTETPTPTNTHTPTNTPTRTSTPTKTSTPTQTSTKTPKPTKTNTPTLTATTADTEVPTVPPPTEETPPEETPTG